MKVLLLLLLAAASQTQAARLSVSGGDLVYGSEKVYLSGANAAWDNYGYDFGNNEFDFTLDEWIENIGAAGGNSFRVWAHVEGYNTPEFDTSGMVTACDDTGDFINDIIDLLNTAESSDVLVILTLWNGAVISNEQYRNLIMQDDILESYLSNCLAPLAQAVAGHPALGAWEAINEPEGAIAVAADPNPCYDTTLIGEWGAGWTGANLPMERLLRMVGRINQVVRENDPGGLVTLGSWAHNSQSDAFSNTKNHYTDECLDGAAGGPGAGIDFYQMHTYDKDWGGVWGENAPFTVTAEDYAVGKPIVIGEFSSACAAGMTIDELHEYGYSQGYAGTWTWHWSETGECSDTRLTQREGLRVLADRTDNGMVDIVVG